MNIIKDIKEKEYDINTMSTALDTVIRSWEKCNFLKINITLTRNINSVMAVIDDNKKD